MEKLFDDVVRVYSEAKSIRKCAYECGISDAKVKKILITLGLYKNSVSVRIARLVALGYDARAIVEQTGLSSKVVNANMPYTKGVYNGDTPTKNALAIRRHKLQKR